MGRSCQGLCTLRTDFVLAQVKSFYAFHICGCRQCLHTLGAKIVIIQVQRSKPGDRFRLGKGNGTVCRQPVIVHDQCFQLFKHRRLGHGIDSIVSKMVIVQDQNLEVGKYPGTGKSFHPFAGQIIIGKIDADDIFKRRRLH